MKYIINKRKDIYNKAMLIEATCPECNNKFMKPKFLENTKSLCNTCIDKILRRIEND